LKILFQYFAGSGGGGALSNIILLLQALAKEYPDDQIDIVCSKGSDLGSLAQLPNVQVIPYGGRFHKEVDRAALGAFALNRIARKRGADIIWSLNLGAYFRCEIPHVLSVNNSHQVYPWHFRIHHPDSPITVAALRWFFRRSLRVSDGVVVQTALMAKYIKAIGGEEKPVQVVPKSVENSADVATQPLAAHLDAIFQPGPNGRLFTFLYVSTLMPHKNHRLLFEILDVVAAQGIPLRVALTLSREELEKFGGAVATRLIESGHILPLGWVKKEQLKAVYDASDACLMPSLLESLSSAHLEAMQWGKPQISSDAPFASDLCGDAAVYVSPEKPGEWVMAMLALMQDDTLRSSLISKGYKRMESFPKTWAMASRQIHSFLDHIVVMRRNCDGYSMNRGI